MMTFLKTTIKYQGCKNVQIQLLFFTNILQKWKRKISVFKISFALTTKMLNNLLALLPLLRPLGVVYGFFMRLRSLFYETSILKRFSYQVPVISVGNLTMGGSGKTPIVISLAQFFLKKGYRPAVVSRGYGGKAKGKFNVVSDGKMLYLNSFEAGDEPRLIAEKASGVAVVTGKKRKYPCQYAVDELGCDLIILDDGFQHLSVQRDIDLVLFNAETNLKLMHVLPSGLLREPVSALNRASAFIVSGCNIKNPSEVPGVVPYLQGKQKNKPLYQLSYVPSHFVDQNGKIMELDAIQSPMFAFCGIAAPHRFFNTLKNLPAEIIDSIFFKDHQDYNQDILQDIVRRAKNKGSAILVTTEKDLIKLKALDSELPLYALCMEVERSPSFDTFIIDSIDNLKHT
jgi:tetraacyldisaccharide 4'-kinase